MPAPIEYATLVSPSGSTTTTKLPVLIWLHGGGGSRRFLETCRAQFVGCWANRSLPAMVVATPSAGWSYYLDRFDGSERWETFLLDEFVPAVRAETGATDGPLLIGGISVGALAALRMAFRHPDRFRAVAAVEPTVEAALAWSQVGVRDRVHLPGALRAKLFGDPVDPEYWQANHPPAMAIANATAIAASELAIYLEAGGDDRLHVQHGTEMLHRCLFEVGLAHEFRLTMGGDHVGPSVGPRLVDALEFLGRVLWSDAGEFSADGLLEVESFASRVRGLERQSGYRRTETIEGPHGPVTMDTTGDGPPVILLPSLGRGPADFAAVADRLAAAGFQAVAPHPRSWNRPPELAGRELATATLADLADDVAAVIRWLDAGPAAVVGHDFGGQLALALAARHPSMVRLLALLTVPGSSPVRSESSVAHRRVFVPELGVEERLEAVDLAFFAPGNDPVAWLDGWDLELAGAQMELRERTADDDWLRPTPVDTLVVHPELDRLVTTEGARALTAALGPAARATGVPGAGHALLPEQPDAVATTLLAWLRRFT